MDSVREWWAELREHWDDHYWHADHPEVRAVLVGVLVLLGILAVKLARKGTRP